MAGLEHYPVLLEEAIIGLALRSDGIYIDGTFGRGGHAALILEQLGEQGRLIAFDKDDQAVAAAQQRFGDDPRFVMIQGSFTEMAAQVQRLGYLGRVDGVLLDLGVSSPQLDDPERGFSFRFDGPLDMRMGNQGQTATEWLAEVSEGDLARVLKEYGEERFAKRIARAIVQARANAPITTTLQLAEIVRAANPNWERRIDPATRSFQGIRIFINRELDDLRDCLEQMLDVLAVGGRLVVISFHSLEDRIVKQFIRHHSKVDTLPRGLPILDAELPKPRMRSIGKMVRAGEAELAENVRSRSAVMRVAEKLL